MTLRKLIEFVFSDPFQFCEYTVYVFLALYLLANAFLLFARDFITRSLVRLRTSLLVYFFVAMISLVLFEGVLCLTGPERPLITSVTLILLTLTIQIQVQIMGEIKLRNLKVPRIGSQFIVMRQWILILLGAGLLIVLNSGTQSLFLILAKLFHFSELNKSLIFWLRVPLTLFICQLIFEALRTHLIRYEFLATPLKTGDLYDNICKIAQKYSLQVKKVFLINLDKFGFDCLLGHKAHLFTSKNLRNILNENEFEFLVTQALLDTRLKLEKQRLVHYTLFSAALTLPYGLALQGTPYLVPENWIVPIWFFLFIFLLVTQQFLKKGINALQFALKCQKAASMVGLSYKEISALYQKLNTHNKAYEGPRVIFGLPQAPRLFQIAQKHFIRAQRSSYQSQFFTPSLRPLLASAFVLLISSAVILQPRYKLRAAAAEGDLATVKQTLSRGLGPNSIDILSNSTPTPLLAASNGGHLEVVRYLLEKGAYPNMKLSLKITPLLLASEEGHLAVVEELVKHGANVNDKGYKGYTPLMLAARFDHRDVVTYLIKNGANVNTRSDHKSTALMLGIQSGDPTMVKQLISSGADVRLRDEDKDSALDVAKRKKFYAIANLIEGFSHRNLRRPASH